MNAKPDSFSYRSARSGSLVAGLSLAIAVETILLHLWLTPRHPLLGWTLTVSSLAAIGWLTADYQALGRGVVRVAEDVIGLRVGRRFDLVLPTTSVASATRPTWKEVPSAGTSAADGYLNLMKPAEPNVLLTLSEPAVVKLPGGLRRAATRLGLHLDAPDDFIAAVRARAPRMASVACLFAMSAVL